MTDSVDAPRCAPPKRSSRAPKLRFPADACDCHAHVLGPRAKYPYAPQRVYTPDDCVPQDYRSMLSTLGVTRAVLVQPSVYGTDNRAMLDALASDPARLRGVAVVDPSTDDATIEVLHTAGVRGARVNVVDVREGKGRVSLDDWRGFARRIAPLGWHLEFLLHVDAFDRLDRDFGDFPVPVVFGHFGYMPSTRGLHAPGFEAMLRLMRDGRAWVKLTGPYRISAQPMPHADLIPFARAIVECAASQVVWGSDWPHVMVRGEMPDDGDLADLLADWLPEPDLRERVLVANPARLYGFA